MMNRFLALALFAGLVLVAHRSEGGPIYRFVDEAGGVVVFTDNPWQFDVYRRQLKEEAERNPERSPAVSPGGSSSEPGAWPRDEAARSLRIVSITREVMHLAGMSEQIQVLTAIAQSETHQLSWRFRWSGAVRARLAKAFDPAALRQGMSRSLARRLDPVRTAALLAWLRSPLSRRIVALESAPTTGDRSAAMARFINQLPSTPLHPSRLALMHRIARASQAAETTAVVMAATGAALRQALPPPAATEGGATPSDEVEPGVDEMLRFRTMAALLFTYRDLRDDEIDRYASFLESPLGRWFTRISRDALLDSLMPPRERNPGAPVRSAQR